jgi:pimeloyl-ACP methyl ester carboxylesterase
MTEEPVHFLNEEKKLFAIFHQPDEEKKIPERTMVIFLHGWAGYRIGPHQMFVKLARRLTNQGYYCFRFDFSGRGYSDGKRENANFGTMYSDLDKVLKFISQKYFPKYIVLLGICSGAKVAIQYIMQGHHKVDHVIELSSLALWGENQLKSEIRHSTANVYEYFKKLFRIETWEKLFSGQLNLKIIWRIILKPITYCIKHVKQKIFKTNRLNELPNAGSNNYHNLQKRIQPFANFNGEIFLIHGEKDPETEMAKKQIITLCQNFKILYHTQIIAGANHSFYSLKWEQEIFQNIEIWLNNKFGN